MKRYQITLYKQYPNVGLYSIQEQGASLCETDQFFKRFKDDETYSRDIQIIKRWVEQIGERGAKERYFKPEGRAKAIPLPPPKSDLRLYCYRISDNILILGNGGIKTSKKVKDSPDAFPHFKIMNDVAFVFELKRSKGEIKVDGTSLSGDLSFFIKEPTDRK